MSENPFKKRNNESLYRDITTEEVIEIIDNRIEELNKTNDVFELAAAHDIGIRVKNVFTEKRIKVLKIFTQKISAKLPSADDDSSMRISKKLYSILTSFIKGIKKWKTREKSHINGRNTTNWQKESEELEEIIDEVHKLRESIIELYKTKKKPPKKGAVLKKNNNDWPDDDEIDYQKVMESMYDFAKNVLQIDVGDSDSGSGITLDANFPAANTTFNTNTDTTITIDAAVTDGTTG